ncbi:uncharacterized protein LOC102802830 [Saccoglossus kowalevskii]|uniref:Uncharacterized protein LOC102802830 n=1 Tax=Saccoglossus kowalevskii TaxID=10224 RepID=A0ABM0MPT2_SACKO|nr:PREDICTED: uncharacterized protein LOC102802830 [Saccoglossus kowalevskii]
MSLVRKLSLMCLVVVILSCVTEARRRDGTPKWAAQCPSTCLCKRGFAGCSSKYIDKADIAPMYRKLAISYTHAKTAKTIIEHAPNVKELKLSDHKRTMITSIPTNFFAPLDSLVTLDIPTLTARKLPKNFLAAVKKIPNLTKLKIGRNRINCNCDLMDFVEERGIDLSADGVVSGCLKNEFDEDSYSIAELADVCEARRPKPTIISDITILPSIARGMVMNDTSDPFFAHSSYDRLPSSMALGDLAEPDTEEVNFRQSRPCMLF